MPNRQMRLTPELVARVPPYGGATGQLAGRSDLHTDAELAAIAQTLLAQNPGPDVWVFAYGSLIWNPDFDHVEQRLGTAHGWHRAFCLGWVRIYRGTPERPGIMLAMDRGGACKGVLFRLPPGAVEQNLLRLLRREMPIRRPPESPPAPPAARWINVRTAQATVRALAFPISRRSNAYLPGLTMETIVQALATAAGERGSMAEYLHNTVTHLERHGIHDRYLWQLQDRVAAYLESAPESPASEPPSPVAAHNPPS